MSSIRERFVLPKSILLNLEFLLHVLRSALNLIHCCCVRAPVGVFNITTRRICIGRGLCSLSPLDLDVDIEYWFYALCSLTEYYEGKATGSTFKAISGDIIRNTVIAVPPKMEQKRIREQITRLFSVLKEVADTI